MEGDGLARMAGFDRGGVIVGVIAEPRQAEGDARGPAADDTHMAQLSLASFEGELLLEELAAILESCGGDGLVEFGVDAEDGDDGASPWAYDGAMRVLSLRRAALGDVWRAARRSPDHGAAPAATLLLMADDYTAWNRRKRTTGASVRDALRELDFCAVCLRRHAKAPSAWAHRKWCFSLLLARLKSDGDAVERAVHDELAFCASLCFRHARNYGAWGHRTWVCRLAPHRDGVLDGELEFCAAWLGGHVTDYSCASHALAVLSLSLAVAEHDDEAMGAYARGRRGAAALRATAATLAAAHAHLDAPAGALRTLRRALARLDLADDRDDRAEYDGAPAKPGDLTDDALWAAAAAHARPPAYAKPLPYPAADAADDHDHDDGEMFFSSGNYGDHIFG